MRDVTTQLRCVLLAVVLLANPPMTHAQSAGSGEPVNDIQNAVKGLFNFLGNAIGGLLDQKGSELKALIDARKFDDASRFYVTNQAALDKSETAKALLPRLAEGLGAELGAQAPALAEKLKSMGNVPPAMDWPALKAELDSASSLLRRFASHAFFQRQPALAPSWVASLTSARDHARNQLIGGVAKAFFEYDHIKEQSFLDRYPVPLDSRLRTSIAVTGSSVWMSALMRSDESQAQRLVRTYVPLLSTPDSRMVVSIAYADVIARARGWSSPRSLEQNLKLVQALKDAGLEPAPAAREVKIAVVRGLNQAADNIDWQPEQIGLPVQQIKVQDLAAWAKGVISAKPRMVYVLVEPSRLMLHAGVRSVNPQTGARPVGQREQANPAWDEARSALESARNDYAETEEQDRQNQVQAQSMMRQSSGLAVFGGLAGAGISNFALQSARDKVAEAEKKFASTPRTVRQPIMQDYKFALATIEAVKRHDVGVYIVDAEKGRFGKLILSETARIDSDISLGVDPIDANAAAADRINQSSRERLAAFGRDAPPLHAGEVWKRLAASSSPNSGQPVSELQKTILDDYKRWETQAAAERTRLSGAAQQNEAQALRIIESQK